LARLATHRVEVRLQKDNMKTYLRVVNPIVSVVVLVLCVWAATWDEGSFKLAQIAQGGIPTYFLAKGVFCSSALFILGRVLLFLIERAEQSGGEKRPSS